jgi:hypothetical protein
MFDQFVKDLLKEKGLPETLEPAVYEKLAQDLSGRVEQLVNKRLLDSLTDEQFDEFEKLTQSNPDQNAVQEFINSNVPDKEQIAGAALAEFRQLYISPA